MVYYILVFLKRNVLIYVIIVRIITDRKVGFEFKDRNLEFLNQPDFYISFLPPKSVFRKQNSEEYIIPTKLLNFSRKYIKIKT